MKVGEANSRLKQLEVTLDSARIDKQNAEAEASLAKEKAEVSKSEVKQIQMMVKSSFLLSLISETNKQKIKILDQWTEKGFYLKCLR